MSYPQVTYHELISHANELGIQFVPWSNCKRGQKVGGGASMNVFSGTFEMNGVVQDAAFKFVTTHLTEATREKKRSTVLKDVKQEIRIMGRLKGHSRIVQLFGVSFDDHIPILIQERAISNLEDYLQEYKPVEWKTKLRFMYDIALGLEAMHKVGVIHGDLKAANVLIFHVDEDQLIAKISDFGFSSTSVSVQEGRKPGYTIHFRSRESFDLELKEWNGKPTSDIYSYGLVIYQVAHNGIVPFDEYDDDEIDNMKIEGAELEVLMESLPANTPLEVQKIITATVRNVPSERLSIDEVKNILKESKEWDYIYSYEEAKFAFESFTQSKSEESIMISTMNDLPIPNSLRKSIFSEYQRLADAGDIASLSRLGSCWYYGFGTEQDHFKAVECIIKAAEAGDIDAMYNLAACYYDGEGVPQDFTKAAELFKKATKASKLAAQNDGAGVPQDHIKAAESDKTAKTDIVEGEGILLDKINTTELYTNTVEAGSAMEEKNLGLNYYYGIGVPQNYIKAIEQFTKAAEAGDATAQIMLGRCYENGTGVAQDYIKAIELYTKAVEAGESGAQGYLERAKQYSV